MCGIAGYLTTKAIDPKVLPRMVERIRHRGPDSEGFVNRGTFAGGMCRLKINGVDSGNQPLFNEDRSIIVFYNGEIYNSPTLRKDLEDNGHLLLTQTDGEVIAHLYEEYGENCFSYLDGMFAISIWDQNAQRLLLARDLPGEKPLYYALLSDYEIAFASEIKALQLFPGIDLSLNLQALWDYPTFLWIPDPSTAYQNVHSLPRGHFLSVDQKGIEITPYANNFGSSTLLDSDATAISETRKVVEEAVTSRLLSDVPLGSFLSGGLDSSIVSSIARKHVNRLSTFCIAFEDIYDPYHGKANEAPYAAALAQKIGSQHSTILVKAKDFRDDLLDFVRYADQPFAVSSGLGVLAIAKKAREVGIKVLLTGDGADEAFGGYSWYPYLCQKRITPEKENDSISFQNTALSIEERLAKIACYPRNLQAWAWHYYASESEKQQLFSKDLFWEVNTSVRHFDSIPNNSNQPLDFIRHDRAYYFPFEMLRKADRMTMAHSVEGRVPFAAPSVLKHVEKLKYHHMVREDSLKWVLREAFADLLPSDVLQRPKHGFNVPIDLWLKNEWSELLMDTFSSDSCLSKHGLISANSQDIALKMIENPSRLNGHSLFCFITLNIWLENFHGNYS